MPSKQASKQTNNNKYTTTPPEEEKKEEKKWKELSQARKGQTRPEDQYRPGQAVDSYLFNFSIPSHSSYNAMQYIMHHTPNPAQHCTAHKACELLIEGNIASLI